MSIHREFTLQTRAPSNRFSEPTATDKVFCLVGALKKLFNWGKTKNNYLAQTPKRLKPKGERKRNERKNQKPKATG